MRRSTILAITFVLIVAIAGVIISTVPRRIDVNPPAIENSPLSLGSHTSSFVVPVSVTAEKLAREINKKAPESVKGEQDLNIDVLRGERLYYTIRRGTVDVRADQNRIHLGTRLSGRATAKAKFCPLGKLLGCTTLRESADIRANVNATLSDISFDANWKPHAKLDVDVNVTKAEVRILGNLVPISLRGKVSRAINDAIPDLRNKFGKLAESMNTDTLIANAWEEMHRTVRLASDPNFWLAIQPTSVGISSVSADDDIVTVTVLLSSNFAVHLDDKPEIQRRPMKRAQVQAEASPGFRLHVPVVADLDDLSRRLNACCTPISISHNGREAIVLSELTLSVNGDRLLVQTGFSTPRWWKPSGTIYVQGVPVLESDVLQFEQLALSVESDDALTQAAAGLVQSLVLDQLQRALKVDMRHYYEVARARIDSAVESLKAETSVGLTVDVERVRLSDVLLGDGKLALVAEMTGAATIDVNSL